MAASLMTALTALLTPLLRRPEATAANRALHSQPYSLLLSIGN